MRAIPVCLFLLFFIAGEVSAKVTSTTVNLSVKFREFTCNIASSRGSNLSFGDVNTTTLTETEGPEIETDLTFTCRIDTSAADLTGNNAIGALQSAKIRFNSPDKAIHSGEQVFDVGNNVVILPFFDNKRMFFEYGYDLHRLSASDYKLKFKLVKKSSNGTISSGTVSTVLHAELTYT